MASNSPLQRSFKRFKRNKPGMIGITVILLSITIAILGYLITPDSTPNADDQVLQIADNSLHYKVTMLKRKKNRKIEKLFFLEKMLFGQVNDFELIPITDYRFEDDIIIYKEYTGKVSYGGDKSLSIIDVVYGLPYEITKQLKTETLSSIEDVYGETHQIDINELQKTIKNEQIEEYTYWFGTDNYGRDMLSRIIIGMRISLAVGVVAVFISIFIGLVLGSMAGYFRGWVDDVIMWFINVVWSIPTLLIAIALTIIFGSEFWLVFIAVGLSMWVDAARLIRGQIMGIREIQYVEAAKSLGFSDFRIIFIHILPNITGPLIVVAAANFASAILVEAGLSFLGLGVQPPAPSWGTMLSNNYGYIISNKPFLALVPGVAIMILVMAFNLVGNGFRDALDVKTKL